MEDLDRRIVSKILRERQIREVIYAGIDEKFFVDGKDVFEYILGYFSRYREIPTRRIVRHRFPQYEILPSVAEPFPALIDFIKDRYVYINLSEMVKEGAEKLRDNTQDAFKFFGEKITGLKVNLEGRDDGYIMASYQRKRDYKQLKKYGLQGIPSVWNRINLHTGGGWQKEQLILLCGRPTIGKTWSLILNARHAWKLRYRVLFVTREMSNKEIMRRMDGIALRVPYGQLVSGKLTEVDERRYFEMLDKLTANEGCREEFQITPEGYNIVSLQQKIIEYQPDIVFIDGVYLMQMEDSESKTDMLYRITNKLKAIAKENRIPIVCTAQMGRTAKFNLKEGADRLSKIQWADSFGQDTDVVIEQLYSSKMARNKMMWFLCLKNREGLGGFAYPTHWNFNQMIFDEYKDSEHAPMTIEEAEAFGDKEVSETAAIKKHLGH